MGIEGVRVGGRCGGSTTLNGGVGGGGELTQEGVGVGKLAGLCDGGCLGGLVLCVGVVLGPLVVGVLAVGLLIVHMQACSGLVAVVLLKAQESGLEDLGVTLGLTGPVALSLVLLTSKLLRLQARLGNGGG